MKKREENRKAQISIFVIISVILLLIIIFLFIFREKMNILQEQSPKHLSIEIEQINSALKDCIRQRAVDAIRIIGLQGGYITLPDKHLKTNISDIAYGYYERKNTLPDKEVIEKEINYYIELTIPFCLGDIIGGYNITKSGADAITKINEELVIVSVKMPISAAKENNVFTIDEYKISIPVKLGNIIDVANEIVEKEIEDPEHIDLSYLGDNKYYVIFSPVDEKNFVYSITDDKSLIDNIPYTFVFANKIK